MGFEERNHKFKIINLKLYMANILITGANGQLGTELRNRSFSLLDDVFYTDVEELDITNFKAICALDRKSTRLNSSHNSPSRMPSSA